MGDNCIVIIQIPLKQKPKEVHVNHTQIQYNYIPQKPQYPQYPSWGMGGGAAPFSFYNQQKGPEPILNNYSGSMNRYCSRFGSMQQSQPKQAAMSMGGFFGGSNNNQ